MAQTYGQLDLLGSFRRGKAGAIARYDTQGAADFAQRYQLPEAATYAALAEKERRKAEEEAEKTYRKQLASAYMGGDYQGGMRVAAERGDFSAVQTLERAQEQRRSSARERGLAALTTLLPEIEGIAQMPDTDRQAAWEGIRARVAETGAPEDVLAWMPRQWGPGVQRGLLAALAPKEALAAQLKQAYGDPDQKLIELNLNDRVALVDQRTGRVVQQYAKGAAPRAAGGGGGARWRPATPSEMQAYGTATPMLIDDETGNVKPIPGAAAVMADPTQRGRISAGLPNTMRALSILDDMEQSGYSLGAKDWGAAAVRGTPFVGETWAKNLGGQDYQRYMTAAKAFEASALPILSGAAVTESEAERVVSAMLPQAGDTPETLRDKAVMRRGLANGFAALVGRPPPFPDAPTMPVGPGMALDSGDGGGAVEFVRDADGKIVPKR